MAAKPTLKSLAQRGGLRSTGFGGALAAKNGVFIQGDKQMISKLTRLEKTMPLAGLDGIKRALLIIEAEAVRLVTSGYFKPAVDTGRMRRSITHKITNFTPTLAEGVVGLNVFYAIYVHEGTIYMEARPFLTDALKNKQAIVQAILVDAFRDQIRSVESPVKRI